VRCAWRIWRTAISQLEEDLLKAIREAGLPEPEREFLFAKPIGRKWRADYCYPEQMLLIEAEGGTWSKKKKSRHTTGSGFQNDSIKYGEAAVLGYRLLRFTSTMIHNGTAVDLIRRALNIPQGED
jgi:very-short-patch-repair endonuclease